MFISSKMCRENSITHFKRSFVQVPSRDTEISHLILLRNASGTCSKLFRFLNVMEFPINF